MNKKKYEDLFFEQKNTPHNSHYVVNRHQQAEILPPYKNTITLAKEKVNPMEPKSACPEMKK